MKRKTFYTRNFTAKKPNYEQKEVEYYLEILPLNRLSAIPIKINKINIVKSLEVK